MFNRIAVNANFIVFDLTGPVINVDIANLIKSIGDLSRCGQS